MTIEEGTRSMAARARRSGHGNPSELTPEQKLLGAILGEQASEAESERASRKLAGDKALFGAIDAISDSLEANLGRWNSELDVIEESLSRSRTADRHAEAAMSDDESSGGGEVTTWRSARDRILRFASNLIGFERTIDRLVRYQGAHQKLLNELDDRVCRIEAQQEIIIRLLERERRD